MISFHWNWREIYSYQCASTEREEVINTSLFYTNIFSNCAINESPADIPHFHGIFLVFWSLWWRYEIVPFCISSRLTHIIRITLLLSTYWPSAHNTRSPQKDSGGWDTGTDSALLGSVRVTYIMINTILSLFTISHNIDTILYPIRWLQCFLPLARYMYPRVHY